MQKNIYYVENLAESGHRVNLVCQCYPKTINVAFRTPLQSIRQAIKGHLGLTMQKFPRNRFKPVNPSGPGQNNQVQKQHKYMWNCS